MQHLRGVSGPPLSIRVQLRGTWQQKGLCALHVLGVDGLRALRGHVLLGAGEHLLRVCGGQTGVEHSQLAYIRIIFYQLWQFVAVQQCMFSSHNTLGCVTWLSTLAAVWIFFIFCGQVGLVAGETTTFQVIRHHNYGVDMWNARGLRNVVAFLSTGSYTVSPSKRDRDRAPGRAPLLQSGHETSRCTSKHCKQDHEAADNLV